MWSTLYYFNNVILTEWNCCMKCMLFTIRHNGPCGSLLYWIGCLLCYYSFFTISYQVKAKKPSLTDTLATLIRNTTVYL